MSLTNEQVLQEIDEAIKTNTAAKKDINEALNHASSAIRTIDKKLKAEYERGLKEAWDTAVKIGGYSGDGCQGYTHAELNDIFGTNSLPYIFSTKSYTEVIAKIKYYEENKNKLTKGDEVVVHCLYDNDVPDEKAIFFSERDGICCMLFSDYETNQIINKKDYTLTKTGRHVDIFGDEE